MFGIKIVKRDGTKVPFDKTRIELAIERAAAEIGVSIHKNLIEMISSDIFTEIQWNDVVSVETIQDIIELKLMENGHHEIAKHYILYREQKAKLRKKRNSKKRLLSDTFLSPYKHGIIPNKMTAIAAFTYYRTYSRWIDELNRREYWWETVQRAVEYNCSLVEGTTVEEAEALFDDIYNLKTFLSGRTLWIGGTEAAKLNPMANMNCSFLIIDKISAFEDLFYILMLGSGVGFRILKSDVVQLPKVRTGISTQHLTWDPYLPEDRTEYTTIDIYGGDKAMIIVGDSKEGWASALLFYLQLLTEHKYKKIKHIVFNYNNVRPAGEPLKVFGGKASGFASLRQMFEKIDNVVQKSDGKLSTLNCLDIANIIGENVVCGGVRRTAEIAFIDFDNEHCINAKSSLYYLNPVTNKMVLNESIGHRANSNNASFYFKKPTREIFHKNLQTCRFSGEPSMVNMEEILRRRPNAKGGNPCFEILLDNEQMCNLVTTNLAAFVLPNNELDTKSLLESYERIVRASYRMTNLDLELPNWDLKQKRDRLLGVSLTGYYDMVNATSLSLQNQELFLATLRDTARRVADEYADSLGLPRSEAITCLKPEGTLSIVANGVTPGCHRGHSRFSLRLIRFAQDEPIGKVMEELGYPVKQDIKGQKFVEFPCKQPDGETKFTTSAKQQLETYLMFQKWYSDHNTSITIHVRDHEWEELEQLLWDEWDNIVGVSFLSLTDHFYPNAPYQDISEEEYLKRTATIKPFDPILLRKYEQQAREVELIDTECTSGACPIR